MRTHRAAEINAWVAAMLVIAFFAFAGTRIAQAVFASRSHGVIVHPVPAPPPLPQGER